MPYPINDTMLGGVSGMFNRVSPPLLGRPEGRPVGAATGTGVQPVGFQNPMLRGLSRAGMGAPRAMLPGTNMQNQQRQQALAQQNSQQMLAQRIMQKYGMTTPQHTQTFGPGQGGQYGL